MFPLMARYFYLLHILLQVDEPPVTIDLPSLAAFFVGLAGIAALVAALVNLGKRFGIVPDGAAPKVAGFLTLAFFAGLVTTRILWPDFDYQSVDVVAGVIAQILVGVLGLIGQLGISKAANAGLRGVPLIGYSHSQKSK